MTETKHYILRWDSANICVERNLVDHPITGNVLSNNDKENEHTATERPKFSCEPSNNFFSFGLCLNITGKRLKKIHFIFRFIIRYTVFFLYYSAEFHMSGRFTQSYADSF